MQQITYTPSEDEKFAFELSRPNIHQLQFPLPIFTNGSLAKVRGLHSVIIRGEALTYNISNYPSTVRFSIRLEGAPSSGSLICEVRTEGNAWFLPLDCEFQAIAKFKKIMGGYNNEPASNLLEIRRTYHLVKGA